MASNVVRRNETRMKTPPWSHSLLHSYEICEYQCYRQYVKRDIPWEPTPQKELGNRAHKALELRLREQTELPEEFKPYEGMMMPIVKFDGEKHFEWKLGIREEGSPCDFYADDVWGRGVLDVVMVKDHTGMILDWKTGKEREDPAELEVQSILLRAARPGLTKIVGRYVWLKTNKLGIPHDLSDTPVKLAHIRAKMEKVKMNMRVGTWQKHANVLCGWCSVKDCEFNRNTGR